MKNSIGMPSQNLHYQYVLLASFSQQTLTKSASGFVAYCVDSNTIPWAISRYWSGYQSVYCHSLPLVPRSSIVKQQTIMCHWTIRARCTLGMRRYARCFSIFIHSSKDARRSMATLEFTIRSRLVDAVRRKEGDLEDYKPYEKRQRVSFNHTEFPRFTISLF